MTYEFENVPAAAARWLADHAAVRPGPASLEAAQDRLAERELFAKLGILAPAFARVDSAEDLRAAAEAVGLPAILKTRRMGYDGKGQVKIDRADQCDAAWDAIQHVPAILDAFVPFEREISVVTVRSAGGEVRCYPPIENVHTDGILRRSDRPGPGDRRRDPQHA